MDFTFIYLYHFKGNCGYCKFSSESSISLEVCPIGRDRVDPLRVSKRLLRALFDKSAIDECWEALWRVNLDETADTDPSIPSLVTSANLKRIRDAVRVLHACNPISRMGAINLASAGRILRSVRVADPCKRQVGSGKRPGPHSQQRPVSSQSVQLEQTIQLIDELKSLQVPSLVQLSVCAVRDAIAGPIELHLHSLLAGQPPQQQQILRSQIQLDAILCENALDGVEEAFASAEALQSKLTHMPHFARVHSPSPVSHVVHREFFNFLEDFFLGGFARNTSDDDSDDDRYF